MRGWLAPLCALLAIAAAVDAAAGLSLHVNSGMAVDGRDRAVLQPPGGVVVEAYEGAGYSLRLRPGGAVEVETSASLLDSRAPFEHLPRRRDERTTPAQALARALSTGAQTRYQVVSRVLGWISANIRYELERSLPQDAASVLARRSGYCTGVARLAVALLGELGIEAREVPGYIVAPVGATSRGFHRWIEVLYPDRGWVMSDPLVAHHVVPATYLRLASEAVRLDAANDGALLRRQDELLAVDVAPGVAPGIRVRRNDDRQLAGALRVIVGDGRSAGLAILEGQGVRLTHALLGGGSTFLGLDPGVYTLRLLLGGGRSLVREIELPGRVRQAVLVPVASASTEVPSPSTPGSLVGGRR